MKRLSLRRNHQFADDAPAHQLRIVSEPAQIISWPYGATENASGVSDETLPAEESKVTVKADIRTKRFVDRRVDEDRYTATVDAPDGSPLSVLTALVDAFRTVEEFRIPSEPGRPLVLELRIRS
jgi:hypothetical protein